MISLYIFYELNTEPRIWGLLQKWKGMQPCVRCSTRVWRAVIWTPGERGRDKEGERKEGRNKAGRSPNLVFLFQREMPCLGSRFIANLFKQFLFKEQDCMYLITCTFNHRGRLGEWGNRTAEAG